MGPLGPHPSVTPRVGKISHFLSPIYRPPGVALDGAQERKAQRLDKISAIAVLVSIFVFSHSLIS